MSKFPLTDLFYGDHATDRDAVTVVDVGCSGTGVEPQWNVFGGTLKGIGFDPREREIERLRSVETRSGIAYEAAYVGLTAAQALERDAYEATLTTAQRYDPRFIEDRSSAKRAASLISFDYATAMFSAGQDERFASRRIALDEWLPRHGWTPDFLKVDTDGADMEVLWGADRVLRASVLGVHIECMCHGPLSRYANSLGTIDAFLRERGFQMYDLDAYRYTKAALPGPFHYDLLAQTQSGQLGFADALYLRDLSTPAHKDVFGFAADREAVIKLACTMEVFGLADCAAELLTAWASELPYDPDAMLDRLVPAHLGRGLSYREYMARFEADPTCLFPSRLAAGDGIVQSARSFASRPIDLATAYTQPEWHAVLRHHDDGRVAITTTPQPWTYAAVLPFAAPRRCVVEIELTVGHGQVALALLGPTLSDIGEQVMIDAGADPRVVTLPVVDPAWPQGVMIRNATDARGGTATIAAARLLF